MIRVHTQKCLVHCRIGKFVCDGIVTQHIDDRIGLVFDEERVSKLGLRANCVRNRLLQDEDKSEDTRTVG